MIAQPMEISEPLLLVISYSIPVQNLCKIISWLPPSSFGHFLCNSYAELMQNPLWMPCLLFKYYSELMQKLLVAAPVAIFYSIIIANRYKIISWLPSCTCARRIHHQTARPRRSRAKKTATERARRIHKKPTNSQTGRRLNEI